MIARIVCLSPGKGPLACARAAKQKAQVGEREGEREGRGGGGRVRTIAGTIEGARANTHTGVDNTGFE